MSNQRTIWDRPGLYVAQLRTKRLVPIDLGVRREHNVLLVNCDDLNVGSARRLSVRRKNYENAFDGNLSLFQPIALTVDLSRAEAAAKSALDLFRIRNPHTGYRHEWLSGVTADEATKLMLSALARAGIEHEPLAEYRAALEP